MINIFFLLDFVFSYSLSSKERDHAR